MIYGYIKPNMVSESFNNIEDSFLNEATLTGVNEPKNLYEYLKKTYKPSDFENLTEESIQNDIKSKRKINLQKEWIQYTTEWINDENDPEGSKVFRSKIKRMEKLKIVMIWDDGGGTELGYDLNSKKIYCFDHDYGFINSSITMKQAVSLSVVS